MKNPLKIITEKQIAALAVIPLVALSMNAQAVVLIDFSDATAAGAGADGNGNYWTSVGDAGLQGNAADLSVANLIDSTNSATTIDLDINFLILDNEFSSNLLPLSIFVLQFSIKFFNTLSSTNSAITVL